MSRKQDLEGHIRESYSILREYEALIRTSERPEEKQRARRQIDGQWALIEGYVGEYRRLAGGEWPPDIAEIAARFGSEEARPAAPARNDRATVLFNQEGQQVGQQINVAGDLYAGGPVPGGGAPPGGPARGSSIPAGWSSETIRRLLIAAFDDQELRTLCFDHFGEVYDELATGMSKGQIVQRLLEHCVRRGQIDRLLEVVRAQNPAQYERFKPHG